jgi:hypothetical protein
LVGPARRHGARSHVVGRTDDNRCSLVAEEGNVVGVAIKRTHSTWKTPNKRLHLRGHVLRSVQRPVHVNPPQGANPESPSCGASRVRRGGRFGIAVGQTCESRRNRHRGLVERTTARLAACHRSRGKSREVVRGTSEEEGGHGHRPREETRVPSSVLVRRNAVAENRQAASWPRISSHAALQKEWR